MKHLTHWILACVALVSVASFSGAWTGPQEPTAKPARKLDRPQGKKPGQQNRGEKQNAIKKVLPTLKTSLAEGIALAEKQASGKAFTASIEIRAEKPVIQVSLFVGEKLTMANVDPETKKVEIVGKPAETPGEGATEGEEGG